MTWQWCMAFLSFFLNRSIIGYSFPIVLTLKYLRTDAFSYRCWVRRLDSFSKICICLCLYHRVVLFIFYLLIKKKRVYICLSRDKLCYFSLLATQLHHVVINIYWRQNTMSEYLINIRTTSAIWISFKPSLTLTRSELFRTGRTFLL